MIHGLHHVAVGVPSLDDAVSFYEEAFGCELLWVSRKDAPKAHVDAVIGIGGVIADVAMLRFGSVHLEVWEYREPAPADHRSPANGLGYPHIAVVVTDIDAEHARLSQLGVTFVGPPVDLGVQKAVYGTDPFGNLIELHETIES